jgi:prolipoprotein diacylglyceryl transferase
MILASIPSPDQGTWQIGFFELRAYALCIIAGVLVAVWLGSKRWVARGGRPGTVADIAVWAVPFGLVGARLYHVATDYQLYFCSTCSPVQALYIWRGGLGIWGAISLGALGAYIGCRRRGISFLAFGDALVPAIAVAQGIGRFGNWFNQELFGKPTTLPWALEIDRQFRPDGYQQFATFHPTFLYEALWDFGIAGLLVWADRRFRLGYGRVIALYVMAYTAGRGWIEMLRIDEANHILGLRLNVWTSILVFLGGLALFVWSARKHPGREDPAQLGDLPRATVPETGTDVAAAESADEPDEPQAQAVDEQSGGKSPPAAHPQAAEPEAEQPAAVEPETQQPEPQPADPEPADEQPAAPEAEPAEKPGEEPATPEPARTPSATTTKPRRRWRLRRRR